MINIRGKISRNKRRDKSCTEIKTNWDLDRFQKRLEQIFKQDWDLLAVSAHNQHDKFNFNRHVGTCLIAFYYLSSGNPYTKIESSGLGRWVSMKYSGGGNIFTKTFVEYIPINYDKVNHILFLAQNRHQLLSQKEFRHYRHT